MQPFNFIKLQVRDTKLYIIPVLILFSSLTQAQDTTRGIKHFVSFKTQFIQIKDEFNYGLVFYGLNFGGAYLLVITSDKSTFSYSPDLAFGVNYNKGPGVALEFKPVDLFYGLKVNRSNSVPVTLGPYFATCYQWQMYPELQSGHLFWFSSIELGPRLMLSFPIKKQLFKVNLSNSLLGWASRPVPATETYFYSHQFSDFVKNVHSNLEFGSVNLFNHTGLEVEMLLVKRKRLSLAYEFEYFGYYDAPKLQYITHSFNLKWRVGKITTK